MKSTVRGLRCRFTHGPCLVRGTPRRFDRIARVGGYVALSMERRAGSKHAEWITIPATMKITVKDVCAAMDAWAPPSLAYDWDRVGLSIGVPGQRVRGVLTCLTLNRGAFAAAKKAKADMIVSHHPLIWEPLKALRTDDPHTRLCLDCAQARIACFAAHTNLDAAQGGVNDVLARALGLEDLKPLFPLHRPGPVKLVTFIPGPHVAKVRDAVSAAGAGVIGDYTHCSFSAPGTGTFLPGNAASPFSGKKGKVNEEPEHRFETLVPKARLAGVLAALFDAHPYEEVAYDLVALENQDPALGLGRVGSLPTPLPLADFAAHVNKALKLKHLRYVGAARKRVKTVAVFGGAGGGEAAQVPEGIDVFVTGDVKYHDADTAAARGLAVIDAGHAGTEKGIVPAIAAYLRKQLPGVSVRAFVEPELFNVVKG